jgi:hypothetical protein
MRFLVRRRISWVFIAWVAAGASLLITSRGEVCEDRVPPALKRYDPTIRTISALIHEDDPGVFILLQDQVGRWQKDVGVGDDVVSFGRLFLDRRMQCEFVFVDERHWFGFCAVYPWQGDSYRDIISKNFEYRHMIALDVYFIGASGYSCHPILLRKQVGTSDYSRNWANPRLSWAVVQEMARWAPSARRAVHLALEISPSRSRIHQLLSRSTGLPDGWRSSVFGIEELESMGSAPALIEAVPPEIQRNLSGEQLRGLEDFFDDKVLAIP